MFAKTSNNKHDWNPVKYLNVFASQQNTKTVAILFLIILQKLNKLPFLGTLDMSGFHQKLIIQLVEVLILMNSTGPFHAQCKKIEKIKNDDLDLIYIYFRTIISYEFLLQKKTAQNSPKTIFQTLFSGVLTQRSGWDRYVQPPNNLPNVE